jgi:hypothetical protein
MTKNSMIIRMPNEEIFNGVCMVEQKGRDVPTWCYIHIKTIYP